MGAGFKATRRGLMGCCTDRSTDILTIVRDIFGAAAITCLLYASHRIARGLLLNAEVVSLAKFGEAYTPEEREQLIHKIKVQSLRF